MNRAARATVCAVATSILIAGCSADPQKLKITEQNKATFMQEIEKTKGLTPEEVILLTKFQARSAISTTVGRDAVPIVGLTVADLIANQRKFEADTKAEEERQAQLAAAAKAKADAMAAELRKAVSLTVFDKGFIPRDIMASRFDDYITIKCAYENTSGKPIRAFQGRIQFTDLFDKEIYSVGLRFPTRLLRAIRKRGAAQSNTTNSLQLSRISGTLNFGT